MEVIAGKVRAAVPLGMAKPKKALDWVRFTRKIGEHNLDAEYAIDGRMLRVRSQQGSKATLLGGSTPENLAAMLALELAKERP
jgi:hypothetical protein